MSKKGSVKLSEEELIETIVKREKFENRLAVFSNYALIIGLVGGIIFLLVGISALTLLFWVVCALGIGVFILWDAHRDKTASMVNKHLDDFHEAELQKAFGPCLKTSEMNINKQLMEKLRPVDLQWDECDVWCFYESNYHGTHFSADNVRLNKVTRNQDGVSESPRFEGAVLRCKDICAPALDIFLLGSWPDHHPCDLMEPAVFRQYFSALTADGQSADVLVTPQMRELIQNLMQLFFLVLSFPFSIYSAAIKFNNACTCS